MKKTIPIIAAIAAIAAMSGCRQDGGQVNDAPWYGTVREADIGG